MVVEMEMVLVNPADLTILIHPDAFLITRKTPVGALDPVARPDQDRDRHPEQVVEAEEDQDREDQMVPVIHQSYHNLRFPSVKTAMTIRVA